MNTCGNCKHTAPIPNDLMYKVCMGGPPQLMTVMGPNGQPTLMTMRPNVGMKENACSLFAAKLILQD